MGLLDSPYVGQLVKSGTITKETTSSGFNNFIGSTLNASGYNSCIFKISATNWSGTTLNLRGTDGLSQTGIFSVYKIDYNKSDILTNQEIDEVTSDGFYISTNISRATLIRFWLISSGATSITLEYWLCNNDFIGNVINTRIKTESDAIRSLINSLSNKVYASDDVLMETKNVTVTSVNSAFIDSIKSRVYAAGKKYLRMNVTFNSTDADVKVAFSNYYGDSTSGTRYKVSLIGEDGLYKEAIYADKVSADYYLQELGSGRIMVRVEPAGASSLTCTIKLYATDYLPALKHIHPIQVSNVSYTANVESSITVTLSDNMMSKYKFFFCSIGTKSYSKSGSIEKNWSTNDEEDSDVIAEFSNVYRYSTKWYPVTFVGGTLTFKVTATSSHNDTITVYGVV